MGRLTKDPELRTTQNNKQVVSFSIAINRFGDNGDADFFDCQAWDKQAELIANSCKKGHRINISGRLRQERWQDQQSGQSRFAIKIQVQNFDFIEPKDQPQQQGYTMPAQQGYGTQQQQQQYGAPMQQQYGAPMQQQYNVPVPQQQQQYGAPPALQQPGQIPTQQNISPPQGQLNFKQPAQQQQQPASTESPYPTFNPGNIQFNSEDIPF